MNFLESLPIIIIFFAAVVLSAKNLKWGVWGYILLVPLMHKELFSVSGIWDLLPIRIYSLGLILVGIYRLTPHLKSKKIFRDTFYISLFKSDPFALLLTTLLVARFVSMTGPHFSIEGVKLLGFTMEQTMNINAFKVEELYKRKI